MYGPRIGFAAGGVLSFAGALLVGLMLARAGGLRLKVDMRRGHKHLDFVPRQTTREPGSSLEAEPSAEAGARFAKAGPG